MAALTETHPTLLDFKSRLDPNNKVAKVIEVLDQRNENLDDMVILEANEMTSHLTSMRSGIPEPSFRKLYGFTQPSKSRSVNVRDNIGMMESYAEIDKALADLNGNAPAWRLSEETPFIQGFNQKLSRYLIYGNEDTEPEGFTGLAPRFNSKGAANGENIITDGTLGGNDGTSIWLIVWGPNTVHGIYPKGSQAGIQITDKGVVTKETSEGMAEMYRTHYRWDMGLSVRDWRYVVRMQIDVDTLTKTGSTGADLIDLFAQATEMVPDLSSGKAAFYCNRKVRGFLRRQIMNKTVNSSLTIEQITRANGALIHVPMFDGIPVRRVDQILNTESAVGA